MSGDDIGLLVPMFWVMMALAGIGIYGAPDAVMSFFAWLAPNLVKIALAVFGGRIVKIVVRAVIKHRFGLEVPV